MALTRFQDTEQIGKDVSLLAKDLEKLRLAYEQYFLGLAKDNPVKLREGVTSLIRKHAGVQIRNAGLRFKLQQTIARYTALSNYWDRVLRQIEEGTYTRDVFRAKLHEKDRTVGPKKAAVSKAAMEKPDAIATLFDKYVSAKKKCNENTDKLSIETFRKSITSQVQALKKKSQTTNVRFKVVTEDGKTRIRAFTKK